jgi:hypothetical protein
LASTLRGALGGDAGPPLRLLLGSLHCHSTFSDGAETPWAILAKAGAVGLDFLAISDHLPVARNPAAAHAASASGPAAERPPLICSGVLRIPAVEYSPPGGNHCLVLGVDPWEAPNPAQLPGWPDAAAYMKVVAGQPGLASFLAHPDDEGNPFLGLESYRWTDWTATGYTGLEVWNLSTDLARTVHGFRDILRAALAGLYRAVPPPHPCTLARWDSLAQRRQTVGIAGTDAHAFRFRRHGLRLTLVPYERAFGTLQTAVWVNRDADDGPPSERNKSILEALGRGRAFMVNRVFGHPRGFVFRARPLETKDPPYISGDVIPAGRPVRFEVATPVATWIRLIRNGLPVANTYGRELSFEPLGGSSNSTDAVFEAWRAEVWIASSHWNRTGSGFFLWVLSNHIYRSLG